MDEGSHVAVEEGQQQRRDVVAVAVCIHQQDDFFVAKLAEINSELGDVRTFGATNQRICETSFSGRKYF